MPQRPLAASTRRLASRGLARGSNPAVNKVVDHIVTSGRASRRGGFLWSNDKTQSPVRDRSGLPAATRKLEMVSNEELAEADCIVVGRSYDIARDQAPVRAFKLLGYSRATDAIKIGSTEW